MVDLYLQEIMKGKTSSAAKKDKFDVALEKYLDEYVTSLTDEDENSGKALLTPQMKKSRLKEKAKAGFDLEWLTPHVAFALTILSDDTEQHLENTDYQELMDDFSTISEKLDQLDVQALSGDNYQTILNISETSMNSIWRVALIKYSLNEYKKSLALFSLLGILAPENPEYWLRMGIAARQSEDLILALQAFSAVINLDPNDISARLLAAECYISLDQVDAAKAEYLEAERIKNLNEVAPELLDLFSRMGDALKT